MALSENTGTAAVEGRPAAPVRRLVDRVRAILSPVSSRLGILEVDTRLIGMIVALAVIWISVFPGTSVRLTAKARETPIAVLKNAVQVPRTSEFFSAET